MKGSKKIILFETNKRKKIRTKVRGKIKCRHNVKQI